MSIGTPAPDAAPPRLTHRSIVGYSFGAAGSAGFGTVPGLILAIYLTNTLGVAAGLASLVVLIPKLWDVAFLPFVGTLSDRYTSRHGSRARYLVYGAIGMLICFPLMFAVPEGTDSTVAAAWVLIAFLIAASAFGFFQVPFIALSAEITDSPRERTTLMSWRVGLQMIGILIFGIGAPLIVNATPQANTGYLIMGLAVGSLVTVGMLICWASVRHLRRYVSESSGAAHSPIQQFRAAWQSRQFRILLSAFVLQALGAGAALAAAPYFSQNVLGVDNFGIVFGVLLVPAVLVMPLWALVGHRIGKQKGYFIACILFIVGLVCSVAAQSFPLGLALVFITITSAGYAGMQMFPLAILPDTIAADARETGVQRAGSFTGVWAAGETAAFAIGPALVLLLLAATGFVSSTGGGSVTQPASAVTGVTLAFSLLPAILVAFSLPLILRYSSSKTSGT
jgi:GPH family glycoside/pentoside/hexuronide:cation symporter